MDAQEKQREETVKQLRSQAEMSESMQQRMQGEMKSYMEVSFFYFVQPCLHDGLKYVTHHFRQYKQSLKDREQCGNNN